MCALSEEIQWSNDGRYHILWQIFSYWMGFIHTLINSLRPTTQPNQLQSHKTACQNQCSLKWDHIEIQTSFVTEWHLLSLIFPLHIVFLNWCGSCCCCLSCCCCCCWWCCCWFCCWFCRSLVTFHETVFFCSFRYFIELLDARSRTRTENFYPKLSLYLTELSPMIELNSAEKM